MNITIVDFREGTDDMTGRETEVLVLDTPSGRLHLSFSSFVKFIRLETARQQASVHGDERR
jgi:hypothetical protein